MRNICLLEKRGIAAFKRVEVKLTQNSCFRRRISSFVFRVAIVRQEVRRINDSRDLQASRCSEAILWCDFFGRQAMHSHSLICAIRRCYTPSTGRTGQPCFKTAWFYPDSARQSQSSWPTLPAPPSAWTLLKAKHSLPSAPQPTRSSRPAAPPPCRRSPC